MSFEKNCTEKKRIKISGTELAITRRCGLWSSLMAILKIAKTVSKLTASIEAMGSAEC